MDKRSWPSQVNNHPRIIKASKEMESKVFNGVFMIITIIEATMHSIMFIFITFTKSARVQNWHHILKFFVGRSHSHDHGHGGGHGCGISGWGHGGGLQICDVPLCTIHIIRHHIIQIMDDLDQYQHITIILAKYLHRMCPLTMHHSKVLYSESKLSFSSSRQLFGLMGANLNRNVIVTGGAYAGKNYRDEVPSGFFNWWSFLLCRW